MRSRHDSRGFKVANEWSFDEGVVPILNDMMERSIPGYGDMRDAIALIAAAYIQCQDISLPRILDVGCATGESYSDLYRSIKGDGDYFGVDNSQPMIDHCLRRWSLPLSSEFGGKFRASFFHHDIAGDEPLEELGIGGIDIALCVLTMHFVPEIRRRHALKKIYQLEASRRPG